MRLLIPILGYLLSVTLAHAGTLTINEGGFLNGKPASDGSYPVINSAVYVNGGELFSTESPSCITINSIGFSTGSIFNIDVGGDLYLKVACTDHDQLRVKTAPDLSNVQLKISTIAGSYSQGRYKRNAITVIDNLSDQPVTKKFPGIDEAGPLRVNSALGEYFMHVSYLGGDGNDVIVYRWDDDNDGVSNGTDKFPADPSEQVDTDGDGVGDNADQLPYDARDSIDSDEDGIGDTTDPFPRNPLENVDSDGDGIGDNKDVFPNDASEWLDTDGDGIGDNQEVDADNDGLQNTADNCPVNANADQQDTDGDLVGDACDIDADNDGLVEIHSALQLHNIRHDLAGASRSDFYGANTRGCGDGSSFVSCNGYELAQDIDLSGDDNWMPIGHSLIRAVPGISQFTAAFEGNGHLISNLVIGNQSLKTHIGLFAYAKGVAFKNVKLAAQINSDSSTYVGSLVGRLDDGSIDNSSAKVNIIALQANQVGGLVGLSKGSSISNSYTQASIQAAGQVGGLAGYFQAGPIRQSYSLGDVTGTGARVGGLTGMSTGHIYDSYSAATVSGASAVGGLTGYNDHNTVQNTFAYGAVSGVGDNPSAIGGLIGRENHALFVNKVIDSYWDTLTTGQSSSNDGQGYTTDDLQLQVSNAGIYQSWSAEIWDFGSENQYPALIINGVAHRDSDADGVFDSLDAFPNDASETLDTDKDGTGDNADAFPNDASETLDTDKDGTGDNADAFPNDASETLDSDKDGTGDNADAFPSDASETLDSDKDGTGDNADAFPNDASETLDSDKDGTGDNADAVPYPAGGTFATNASSYQVDENHSSLSISILRTLGNYGLVSIDYRLRDVTANASSDYQFKSGTLVFAAGETEKTIFIDVIDDDKYEGNETFEIILSNLQVELPKLVASIGSTHSEIVIVENEEKPASGLIGFKAKTIAVDESKSALQLTINRTGGSFGELRVSYNSLDGTANSGADFSAISGMLNFQHGEVQKEITIDLLDDDVYEGTERFKVQLQSVSGGMDVNPEAKEIEVSITENDPVPDSGTLSFIESKISVAENSETLAIHLKRLNGHAGSIRFTLIAAPYVGKDKLDSSATIGEDLAAVNMQIEFSSGELEKSINIPLIDDLKYEGDEYFILTMSKMESTIQDVVTQLKDVSAVVQIIENDAAPLPGVIGFSALEYKVVEGEPSLIVTVTRANGSEGAFTVDVNSQQADSGNYGHAVEDVDYQALSQTLSFADGELSKVITLNLIDDSVYEGTEATQLHLSKIAADENEPVSEFGLPVFAAKRSALVLIEDNEPKPASGNLQFVRASERVKEDESSFTIDVSRLSGDFGEVSVDIQVTDFNLIAFNAENKEKNKDIDLSKWQPAIEGEDYKIDNKKLVFASGEMIKTVTIELLNDKSEEVSEGFRLKLVNPVNTELKSKSNVDVIIDDDDTPAAGAISLYFLWCTFLVLSRLRRRG